MAVRGWLLEALEVCSLEDTARDYLLGRGATEETIESWGFRSWDCPLQPCPDPVLASKYGRYFDNLAGRFVCPLRSPRGVLLGIYSRHTDRKDDLQILLPEHHWNTVWFGMPGAMESIVAGRNVYIVEGFADVFALMQLIPGGAVLGSLTAYLSWRHIEFCRRWATQVFMVYDNDEAGRRGTERALKGLRYRGVPCDSIPYGRDGDDPGAIWDRGGRAALQAAFPPL